MLNFTGWLSPTSTWRLLQCPASFHSHTAGVPGPKTSVSAVEQNAGSLAHKAVETWIRSGAYRYTNPGEHLIEHFDRALQAAELRHASMLPNGQLTRTRLGMRGEQLQHSLAISSSVSVSSEVEMQDANRKLRGVLDILAIDEDYVVVIDLKTGSLTSGDLPDEVSFQLLFYAHLCSVALDRLPTKLVVFSLQRGPFPINISAQRIAKTLAAIDIARAQNLDEARPEPDLCRFCPRRLNCEPHWAAMNEWESPDAIRGAVQQVERSDAGLFAVQLATGDSTTWITHLARLPAPTHQLNGRHIAFARVSPRWAGEGRSVASWRASAGTDTAIVA